MQLPWFMGYDAHDYVALNPPPSDIAEEVQSFLEEGVAIVKNAATKSLISQAVKDFERFKEYNQDIFSRHLNANDVVERIVNLHLYLKSFRDVFEACDRALRVQDYLYGKETVLYTSLFFEKGSQQPIHRDTPVFSTIPEYSYFGMWIPLDDVDHENGPLMALKGGHLLPELDRRKMARRYFEDLNTVPDSDLNLWMDYQDTISASATRRGLQISEFHVEAGDVIIWHPQLPHGGAPHIDNTRTRRTIVIHTTPLDTPVYHMSKFFNPDRDFASRPHWDYVRMSGGRQYANLPRQIDFNHKEVFQFGDLKGF